MQVTDEIQYDKGTAMKIRSVLLGCFTALIASGFFAGTAAAAKIGSPGMYQAIVPCRIVDTRRITDWKFDDRVSRLFDVTGVVGAPYYDDQGGVGCDIPLDGTVSAVAISLTAIGSFGTGYMRLWPSNFSEPTATIMNYPDHQGNFNMSTNAIVPIGPKGGNDAEGNSGELWLKNYGATPDVVIDVTGYFVVADGGGTSPQDCVIVNNGEPTLWTAKLTTIGNAVYPTLEVRMQQTGCDLSGENRDNNYEVDVSTNGTVDGAGDVSLTSVVTNGSSPRATITFTGTVSGPASTQTISGTYTATGPSVPTPSGTESGTFTMTHN